MDAMDIDRPRFVIQHIHHHGKGQGMVATEDIVKGELILAERALIDSQLGPEVLFNPSTFFNSSGDYSGARLWKAKYDMLSPADKATLNALHVHPAAKNEEQWLLNLVAINAFTRQVNFHGVDHSIMYICGTMSRVNHSCRPNAVTQWNASSDCATLCATENIAKGTEITLGYRAGIEDFLRPRGERRRDLQESYGFPYRCRVCNLSTGRANKDPALRTATAAIRKEVMAIEPLRAPVDFSDPENHRVQELRACKLYIKNLKLLGAADAKLTEA